MKNGPWSPYPHRNDTAPLLSHPTLHPHVPHYPFFDHLLLSPSPPIYPSFHRLPFLVWLTLTYLIYSATATSRLVIELLKGNMIYLDGPRPSAPLNRCVDVTAVNQFVRMIILSMCLTERLWCNAGPVLQRSWNGSSDLIFRARRRNKKLSYRRGTTRRTVSVEILSTAAQLYEKSHLKRPAK